MDSMDLPFNWNDDVNVAGSSQKLRVRTLKAQERNNIQQELCLETHSLKLYIPCTV